jgi:CO/xanthine dehydrogenase FAD-binding subunit
VTFTLIAPDRPEEAVEILRREGPRAAVLAGGTDLLLDIDDGRIAPSSVLSLRRLPWRQVSWSGSRLTVGSTAPLIDLERDQRIRRELPALWAGVRAVGGVALRHRATMGGNLGRASPASDLIPVLLALDATVQLIGSTGRRELSVAEFVRAPRSTALQPGELIESVALPEPRPSAYVWQRVRPANDISQVGVAVAWSPSAARWAIAAGGVVPTPARLGSAEVLLNDPRPDVTLIGRAAAEAGRTARFQSDKRASEEYRRRVLEALVARAVHAAMSGPRP